MISDLSILSDIYFETRRGVSCSLPRLFLCKNNYPPLFSPMIVKTVLIDLDDTLWATTRNNQSALREVYEAREWSRWIDSFETLRDVYQPINDHV